MVSISEPRKASPEVKQFCHPLSPRELVPREPLESLGGSNLEGYFLLLFSPIFTVRLLPLFCLSGFREQ